MQVGESNERFTGFLTLATFVIVVAVLRIAEDVLIPIALAVLLAFLLSPLVARLTRWGLSNHIATIITIVFASSIIAAVGWLVTAQAVHLIEEIPKYEENITQKVRGLTRFHGGNSLARTSGMVEKLQQEIEQPDAAREAAGRVNGREPLPVVITEIATSPLQVLREVAAPVVGPIGTAGIVIVFVIAMLFQRLDLRDRFVKVISAGKLNVATQAIDDAAQRVSRYLGMQLVVNATYGIPVGLGLYFIGIPSPLLWGLLATLLRFIPFLGPWIAAAFPLALSLAVDPGWSKFLYTAGLFIVLELVSNNIIEIWLYGTSTGISNVALLVAAVFWTWLWGTVGLFLSTPLTVCLLVLGKYVPGLRFLSELLGSDPVLKPPAHFYQRMLTMDYEQMLDLAQRHIEEHSLTSFYDDVFVPALILAEEDRHAGSLAEVRQRFIIESGRELIDELERRRASEDAMATPAPDDIAPAAPRAIVLGIPARDDADELAARMLRHLLRERGVEADVTAITAMPADCATLIAGRPIQAAFVSALPPAALVAARQACRRLKESCPSVRVVVGIWSNEATVTALKPRFRDCSPTEVVTRLSDAVTQLEALTSERRPAQTPAEPSPEELIGRLDLPDAQTDELIDLVTRDLAQAFDIPVSLVRVLEKDRDFWGRRSQQKPDAPSNGDSLSAFQEVMPSDDLLVVEDVSKDRRFMNNPLHTERGIRFCAAAPLRTSTGHLVGGLYLVDTKPRTMNERDRALLRLRASELVEAVELHASTAHADEPRR